MFGFFFSDADPVTNFDAVMYCDAERFNQFFRAMLAVASTLLHRRSRAVCFSRMIEILKPRCKPLMKRLPNSPTNTHATSPTGKTLTR